ncbi:ankyrin repeat domain-containing protein 7 [Eublepharis macularius]|uniref:Ankyrin repeat domain-containing protein 7 n=1 Tax=Eublepharis macularius TaxID=481883 RepID=A0AA97JYL5_EUBMA|nr:ankyrin repeat domain-containing protein 7 [Eublepharis macularius]
MKEKKFFRFGKKWKEQPSPSRPGASLSPSSPRVASEDGGYQLRIKELGKLHRAAAGGDLKKLQQLLKKHDLNQLDEANRYKDVTKNSSR